MTPRVQYKLRGARHRYGGGSSFTMSDWNTEVEVTCPFCGAKTCAVQMRMIQHNCFGFICPGAGKTLEQAASIRLGENGEVKGDGEVDPEL